jgi:hypothetical protein
VLGIKNRGGSGRLEEVSDAEEEPEQHGTLP